MLQDQNIDMICDESNSSGLINVQNKVSCLLVLLQQMNTFNIVFFLKLSALKFIELFHYVLKLEIALCVLFTCVNKK